MNAPTFNYTEHEFITSKEVTMKKAGGRIEELLNQATMRVSKRAYDKEKITYILSYYVYQELNELSKSLKGE